MRQDERGGVEAFGAPVDEHDDDLSMLEADPELAVMFTTEAVDHLNSIEGLLLQLEQAPGDRRLLNDIFRPFHTIKGNAGALGLARIQELAHKVENLLDLARSGRHAVGAAEIDAVLAAVDVLLAMVANLGRRLRGEPADGVAPRQLAVMAAIESCIEGGGAVSAPAAAAPAIEGGAAASEGGAGPIDAGTGAVKVDTGKLDNLVDMVGELVIIQSLIDQDPALQRAADGRLTGNLAQLRRVTADLQRSAMSMRMVPIRPTFQKMARLVRDLSRRSGKQVELVLSGEDTELDRKVVEEINDPLMHMVRNSIDHGLESPEAREAAGKPPAGRLSLSACHEAGTIVIAIGDDGAGLDTARIREKAIERGLIAPADALSPSDIHQLIFQPGFSTAERVTEISGRGVGMDVVRRNIDGLRGRVEIQTEKGVGTTFLVKLPLTLAILDGLLVAVGQERFVLPTYCVRESLRPPREDVHAVQGQPRLVRVRDKLIPLAALAELFGVPRGVADAWDAAVVVIESDGRQAALVVDGLLGKQEVVIKSLGQAFSGVTGVAGGAILGDGRIGLILDPAGVMGLMAGSPARAA